MIVANHDSLLDAVMLGLFLPGRVTVAVSGAELRHPLLRILMRVVPHVVVDAAHPLSLKKLMRRLRQGKPVAVFPQGWPTATGSLTKIYDSAALLAVRCDAQIVPVRVTGTLYTRFSAVGGRFPKRLFPQVTLRVLPPQKLPSLPPCRPRSAERLAVAMLRILNTDVCITARAPVRGPALRRDLTATRSHQRIRGGTATAHRKASLALGRPGLPVSEEQESWRMMPNGRNHCVLSGSLR